MPQKQRDAIVNCSIFAIPANPAAADKATADRDVTFCGLEVRIDETLHDDVIELRDQRGEVISRILNLAVPGGT